MPRKMSYNEFVELIREIEPLMAERGWSLDTHGIVPQGDAIVHRLGARFVYPAGAERRGEMQAGILVYPGRGVDSAEQRGRYRENPDPVKHPGPTGRGWRKRLINYVLSEAKRIGRIEDDDLPFDIEALPVREFARTSDDDLRKFVLGVADCQVFTSAHLNGYDNTIMGMVFMPIAMGAMAASDEFRAMLPDEPEKPRDKPKAPALTLPTEPEDWVKEPSYPAEPTDKPEPKDVPQDILKAIEWGEIEPAEADAYREGEGVYMERLAKWESTVWTPWKVRCDDLAAGHDADKAKYKTEHDAWEAKVSKREAEHEATNASITDELNAWAQADRAYRKAKTQHNRITQRAFAHHFQNLGVIWEWMSKAGPRCINGYPIFFSCRLMHREDWIRAEKAILREQERRETIEL